MSENIVTLKAPAGCTKVRWGLAEFIPEKDGTLTLPRYVAKGLAAVGFAGLDGEVDVGAELDRAKNYELVYFLLAYGVSPDTVHDVEKRRAKAKELFADRGEPAATLSQ
jgi:hypothetical protein